MRLSRNEKERLWRRLSEAYREREKTEAGLELREEVLRRIRLQETAATRPGTIAPRWERAMWRLAPVTAVVILVLAALFFRVATGPGSEWALASFYEPASWGQTGMLLALGGQGGP